MPADRVVDGTELPVFTWYQVEDPATAQGAIDLALARGMSAAAVTLPAIEVAELHTALSDLAHTAPPSPAATLHHLQNRLTAAQVILRLPLRDLYALERLPVALRNQGRDDGTAESRLQRFLQHAGQGWLTTGTWPALRDALADALRLALTQPGAEGLAARDDLLAVVTQFVEAHRQATNADDTEQQRLQARHQNGY
ncbi:hypothetical protein ACPCVO_35155 [Streptomyces umbrinus]|uniref:hypothetical protein n=1 Tax=Streptomyces umbrinus TaxID=67370 RepID=UPI003C2C4F1E